MSTDRNPVPSVVARRPPAPSGDLATVTRLLAGGDEREVVPVAAVDGSLALDVRAAVSRLRRVLGGVTVHRMAERGRGHPGPAGPVQQPEDLGVPGRGWKTCTLRTCGRIVCRRCRAGAVRPRIRTRRSRSW